MCNLLRRERFCKRITSRITEVEITTTALGDLQDALLALERLGGDTGFELGGQVSSFSFHRSDFGGDLPLSDQLKFQQSTGSVLRDHFKQSQQSTDVNQDLTVALLLVMLAEKCLCELRFDVIVGLHL